MHSTSIAVNKDFPNLVIFLFLNRIEISKIIHPAAHPANPLNKPEFIIEKGRYVDAIAIFP